MTAEAKMGHDLAKIYVVLRMSTFMYDHINQRATNAMCTFFSILRKTLGQLTKLIFRFNKLYSLLYHVLQQNFLLFEKKKPHLIYSKKGQRLSMQFESFLV